MSQSLYLQQTNNNIQYSNTENGTYDTINDWPYSLLANNVFFKSSEITISQNTAGANETYGCTGANIFFVCAKDNITIGNTCTQTKITIDGITGYLGLIQNGTFTNDPSASQNNGVTGVYSSIAIKNINMHAENNSDLGITPNNDSGGGAWLCQPFFGYTASVLLPTSSINNCHCDAEIFSTNGNSLNGLGGLVGNSSSLNATNCTFNSNIISNQSGGIFGAKSYYCTAENCIFGSTATLYSISDQSGGIFGSASLGCTGYNCKNYNLLNGEAKGGIFGSYAGRINDFNYISCYAYKCSNYGNIRGSGYGVGGIFGSAGNHSVALNCFNYGAIDVNGNNTQSVSGGIFGGYAIGCTAANCFNIGGISGSIPNNSGGIFGGSVTNCSTYNCYNLGPIYDGGGIFGSGCIGSTASFCYNTGSIDNTSGGIFGSSGSSCIANNCYSVGTAQQNSGAIFSRDIYSCTANYCYSINGVAIFGPNSVNPNYSYSLVSPYGWLDTTAQSVLSYGSNGDWTSIYLNTPFLLSSFNNNFYNNVDRASIEQSANTNLTLSQSGNYFFIFSGNNNELVTISSNLNLNFGQFTSSNSNIYDLSVLRTDFYNPSNTPTLQDSAYMYGYNIINSFILTVNQSPPVPPTPSNFFSSSGGYDILKLFVNKNQQKYVKKNIAHLLKYS